MANVQTRPAAKVVFQNTDRVVIVTGGEGGIGRAICQGFAASGAEVVSLDIRQQCESTANVEFIEADLSTADGCEQAVTAITKKYDGIDVLVNTASIQPPEAYLPVHKMSTELWQKMLDINLSSYNHMARYVLPTMLQQHSGVIVNIASGQGHRTAREVPAYGPIKAANLMQTRQWGLEYARQGIRVVSVSPGAIRTPLLEAALEKQGGEQVLANRHPLGRIGNPDEVANAVIWLASDQASFITSTDLEVDGGLGAFAAFAEPYSVDD